jgi:general secretion pathway protein D
LLLVVKDTEQKRREVENTVSVSIPIPAPVTLQEAQELARSIQQIMEIQRFAIDSAQRMAILRDRISKVRPAQMLFEQLLNTRAEVSITVQLFAWTNSRSRTFGTNLPTSTTLRPLTAAVTLAGSPVSYALGIGSAQAVATAAKSESRLVYQAELRSLSGEKASLLVGTKYPIQTVAYIGDVGSGQNVYRPPASFNFEDLGFNVKLTPKVHDTSEVSVDLDTEFKLLGNQSLNGIPVISNRKFVTTVRLKFGESAVISGLVSHSDMRSLTGPAGLLNLPGLAALLGNDNRAIDDSELVLVLTPHLLNLPPTEFMTKEIWLGSESRPRIPL